MPHATETFSMAPEAQKDHNCIKTTIISYHHYIVMAEVYMTTYKDKKKPPYSLRPSLNGEQNYKIVKILEIPPYHYPIIMDISMDEVMNIICNEFEGEDNRVRL